MTPRNQHLTGTGRVFLMLQGPHGPFFDDLAAALRGTGAVVWRCAFNAGDAHFWSDAAHLIPVQVGPAGWPAALNGLLDQHGVTDIVLYGDARPIHDAARQAAVARNLTLHVLEEGYLRPYWITYERGGANGHSALMDLDLGQMQAALRSHRDDPPQPPASWGDMRQHRFYGALYHLILLMGQRRFPHYQRHRTARLTTEAWLNLTRLIAAPFLSLWRRVKWLRMTAQAWPYSLVLLQLEHDASLQCHSRFDTNAQLIAEVIASFAQNAPSDQHLILKAHPLEDGRAKNGRAVRHAAQAHGVTGRVHYLPGGKLAAVLKRALSVVTANSTGAQQALWRGIPVLALGRAIYVKPGVVSDQTLDAFFAAPQQPNRAAYRVLRDFLLRSSQVPGGFYSAQARDDALSHLPALMLAAQDPYTALLADPLQECVSDQQENIS
ncbi:capsule biosynthesis protein [Paracoccus sp. (in: a-proteobacteria)]|uniref:capsule biosynthesis protein n=1 Tax=Paracoccus sp. TaxID=267 RepID=UPI0026DECE15|nr:capsule biosynthesis protein CapA [Paracoccus sp. (in: a-proteobacteria)]MDO5646455.1 capsule biosynthesis protein CapA [Paracoccus sp. (in: a-proteobacteria)]